MLARGRVLLDIENSPVLAILVRNYIAASFAAHAFADPAFSAGKKFALRWKEKRLSEIDRRIVCVQD